MKRFVLAIGFVLALGLGACGGSSSETPFPLEPDFARMDAGGPPERAPYVVYTGRGAGAKPASDSGAPEPESDPIEE